jgi:hypothetical protein
MEDNPPAQPTHEVAEPTGTAMESDPAPEAGAGPVDAPDGDPPRLDPPENHRYEPRLRSIAGRKTTYQGPIIGISQGWVSRDAKWHAFAARYLDFVMLTDEHLVCFSTGFFSRRPRRRVFREPLNSLVVIPRGQEPIRALRIVGDFNRPLLFQLKSDANSLAFARELVERTRAAVRYPAKILEPKKPQEPKESRKARRAKAIEPSSASSGEPSGEQTPAS